MTQCIKIVSRAHTFGGSRCLCKTMVGSEYCFQHDPRTRAAARKKRGPTLFEKQQDFRKAFTVWLKDNFPSHSERIIDFAFLAYGNPRKEDIPDNPEEFFEG